MKNTGKAYRIHKTGKLVSERQMGPPCKCKNNCFDLFQDNEMRTVYQAFWDMGDRDLQNNYLFGQIRPSSPKRRYRKSASPRKNKTYKYHVRCKDGKEKAVCRKAFLSIHGLQNNEGRLKGVLKQQREGCLTPKADRRGHHNNRPNKVTEEDTRRVLEHIDSFPTYESHYSRNDNPNRRYLGLELSIAMMYSLYTA